MDYVNLGRSGLKVSRISLGCMSFGSPDRGTHKWAVGESEARDTIKCALDLGVNFFDTANVYSKGLSEEITGRLLRELSRREEVVIATKVGLSMRPGPFGRGLSRKAILHEIDESLRRLGTDYVDLYIIHRLDPDTPVEETLGALDDVVRSGKARHIGASSMPAWRFAQMLAMQKAAGWARFISMQNYYNLVYREEEREMNPLCIDEGVGLTPWSPLARGRLARPWSPTPETPRAKIDGYGRQLYAPTTEIDRPAIDLVEQIASARNLSMVQVSLAWLLAQPGVCAPVVGVASAERMAAAVAALDVNLSEEEKSLLGETYVSRSPIPH